MLHITDSEYCILNDVSYTTSIKTQTHIDKDWLCRESKDKCWVVQSNSTNKDGTQINNI